MEQTKRTRQRLKLLGCPYLEGLEDSVIDELIVVSKGEARKRILKWLLGKAHPMFSTLITSMSSLKTETGSIAKLTELLSLLGVCSPNDYDVVKGSSTLPKQVKFIDALTELVYCSSVLGLGGTNHQSDIEAAIADSCVFMDSIVDNEDLPEVFKSDITLIPSDVTYIAGINKEAMKSVKVPSINNLRRQIQEHKDDITNLQSQLDSLSLSDEESSGGTAILKTDGSCISAVQVALSTLIQLIDDFVRCYHDDIEPWLSHVTDTPTTTSLGPISKRVYTMLSMVDELLDSSTKLEEMHSKWQEITTDKERIDFNQGLNDGKVQKVFQELNDTLRIDC